MLGMANNRPGSRKYVRGDKRQTRDEHTCQGYKSRDQGGAKRENEVHFHKMEVTRAICYPLPIEVEG